MRTAHTTAPAFKLGGKAFQKENVNMLSSSLAGRSPPDPGICYHTHPTSDVQARGQGGANRSTTRFTEVTVYIQSENVSDSHALGKSGPSVCLPVPCLIPVSSAPVSWKALDGPGQRNKGQQWQDACTQNLAKVRVFRSERARYQPNKVDIAHVKRADDPNHSRPRRETLRAQPRRENERAPLVIQDGVGVAQDGQDLGYPDTD